MRRCNNSGKNSRQTKSNATTRRRRHSPSYRRILDDMIILPLAFLLVKVIISEPVMKECRFKAEQELTRNKK
ncbi:hypothetical protein HWN40_02075 [Methanolobus zinderi]|uniref:Uncharacterized protein n=1 Tax=Methanolobus zinderi TaxID=536044 RepID=A0A7D5E6T8_9EURY|nr:hypothetical protein [Methanolobus zinderi]QLC49138.1 hypothetical protein HWN40_02075 [Methanolobus zinderi]